MDAMLVTFSNKQVVPATQAVKNYAFLMTTGSFVEIANDSHTYGAIFNGAAGNKLQVTNAAAFNYVNSTGLYSYASATTNGWDAVVAESANEFNKGTYSYAKGVLTISGDYYAVADNCAVYVVNTTTGAASALDLTALATFGAKYDIAVQYDANGYVSLIYMTEADLA